MSTGDTELTAIVGEEGYGDNTVHTGRGDENPGGGGESRGAWVDLTGTPAERYKRGDTGGGAAGVGDKMEAVIVDAGATGEGGHHGGGAIYGRGVVGQRGELGANSSGVGMRGGVHEAYGVLKTLGEDEGYGVVRGHELPGGPKTPRVEGTPWGVKPCGVTPKGDIVPE